MKLQRRTVGVTLRVQVYSTKRHDETGKSKAQPISEARVGSEAIQVSAVSAFKAAFNTSLGYLLLEALPRTGLIRNCCRIRRRREHETPQNGPGSHYPIAQVEENSHGVSWRLSPDMPLSLNNRCWNSAYTTSLRITAPRATPKPASTPSSPSPDPHNRARR
jgi:hypothetical protein